jgi:hypothetical protein
VRPDVDTPARRLTRRECLMHELMAELVGEGRLEAARACRVQLVEVSAERARVAAEEQRGAVAA